MKTRARGVVALTIAGSDSGGGAGVQADLKTFQALGVFGTTAIACVTAQNPRRVSGVMPIEPRFVAEQIARVCEAFPVRAVKTGMLYDEEIIASVAASLWRWRCKNVVVDPVLVATSGARLLKRDALAALQTKLLPLATLVTPNVAEAEALGRRPIRSLADLRDATRRLTDWFSAPVLVKGGHLPGATRAVDVLFDGREFHEFSAPFIRNARLHGAGCTFSAAIAGHLALGYGLVDAIERAKQFIARAIRNRICVGKYHALKL
jgi:hydroxymethylpyrimidine/phosphomethylpyrimidine kinase